MRMLTCLSIITVVIGAGCDAPKIRTKPTERAGGFVSQTIDRVNEVKAEFVLKDLHFMMSTQETLDNRLPSDDEIRDYANKENKNLKTLLENGAVVLAAKRTRDGIWAYEKGAPEKGGWIIRKQGPQKVTAEEFKEMSGK